VTINQLIDYVGWDKIVFQKLSDCIVEVMDEDGKSYITTITPKNNKIGVVLWIPRDEFQAAQKLFDV
jgi:hypothetical protein